MKYVKFQITTKCRNPQFHFLVAIALTEKKWAWQLVASIGPQGRYGEKSFLKVAFNMANQTKESPINISFCIFTRRLTQLPLMNYSTKEVIVEQP